MTDIKNISSVIFASFDNVKFDLEKIKKNMNNILEKFKLINNFMIRINSVGDRFSFTEKMNSLVERVREIAPKANAKFIKLRTCDSFKRYIDKYSDSEDLELTNASEEVDSIYETAAIIMLDFEEIELIHALEITRIEEEAREKIRIAIEEEANSTPDNAAFAAELAARFIDDE
jgi:hypothetical protein